MLLINRSEQYYINSNMIMGDKPLVFLSVYWLLFILFLAKPSPKASQLSPSRVIKIDIVSVDFVNTSDAGGSSYASQGAPIDASVEELQETHPNITFQHIRLRDDNITDCPELYDNVEYMLTQWYYGRTYQVNMTVIRHAACMEGALINRLAANWNILYMATSTPFGGYIDMYKQVLRHFNWTTIFILLDGDGLPNYKYHASTTITSLQESGLKPFVRRSWLAGRMEFTNVLKDFSLVSRALLFFGRSVVFRSFMLTAARSGLTNGEYIYITIEPLPNMPAYGNLNPTLGDDDDRVAADAYQSVLVIELFNGDAANPSSIVKRYPEFEERAIRTYNATYRYPRWGWPPVTYCYFLGLAFGKVLDEALVDAANLADGAAFAQRFLSRTISTRIGDFYVNANGETQSAYAASYFDPDYKHTNDRHNFLVLFPGSSTLQNVGNQSWNGPFNKGVLTHSLAAVRMESG